MRKQNPYKVIIYTIFFFSIVLFCDKNFHSIYTTETDNIELNFSAKGEGQLFFEYLDHREYVPLTGEYLDITITKLNQKSENSYGTKVGIWTLKTENQILNWNKIQYNHEPKWELINVSYSATGTGVLARKNAVQSFNCKLYGSSLRAMVNLHEYNGLFELNINGHTQIIDTYKDTNRTSYGHNEEIFLYQSVSKMDGLYKQTLKIPISEEGSYKLKSNGSLDVQIHSVKVNGITSSFEEIASNEIKIERQDGFSRKKGIFVAFLIAVLTTIGLDRFLQKKDLIPKPKDPKTQKKKNYYDIISKVFLLLILIVCSLTFLDYGITIDEYVQQEYGEMILESYKSGFQIHRYEQLYDLRYYGGLFDVILASITQFELFKIYETRHFICALFGVLSLWGTWRTARLVAGPQAALAALLLLSLNPHYYGHIFSNTKDIPFSALYILSVYYIIKLLKQYPNFSNKTLLKISICIGLAISMRIGGLLLIGYLIIAIFYLIFKNIYTHGINKNKIVQYYIRPFIYVILIGYMSYWVLLPFWPWMGTTPIARFFETIQHMSSFPHNAFELYAGKYIAANDLPWHYIPNYLWMKLPELTIISLFCLPILIIHKLRSRTIIAVPNSILSICLAALFPITYIIIKQSTLYDEIRHILFTIPPLTILSAIGLTNISRIALKNKSSSALFIIFFCFTCFQINEMLRYHPYQKLYFNNFCGGLPQAFGNYHTIPYGAESKAAADALVSHLETNEEKDPPYKLSSTYYHHQIHYYYPNYFQLTSRENADYHISDLRYNHHLKVKNSKIIKTIKCLGIPICYVFEIKDQTKDP